MKYFIILWLLISAITPALARDVLHCVSPNGSVSYRDTLCMANEHVVGAPIRSNSGEASDDSQKFQQLQARIEWAYHSGDPGEEIAAKRAMNDYLSMQRIKAGIPEPPKSSFNCTTFGHVTHCH